MVFYFFPLLTNFPIHEGTTEYTKSNKMAQPSEPPSKLPEIPQYLFDENAGAGVIWPLVTLCVLMLIVVGLRLWARRIKGLALGLDDWLIIACTVRQLPREFR